MDQRPTVILNRPGLPLDPVLQLGAGYVTPARRVTVGVSGEAEICKANPMRVALYILPITLGGGWMAAPYAPPSPSIPPTNLASVPVYIHCRDYPGLTQAEWFVTASATDSFSVWEYLLQSWWGI